MERIWDELENSKEVVEALESTNESFIRSRQNDLIRVLTLLSAILLPLTLVTGFYGMNTKGLVGAGHWWSSLMVLGIMTAIGGVMVWFFHRKRWL